MANGNCSISAYATPVSGETNVADNTFIYGIVRVTIPGDYNGDGTVYYDDVDLMIQAWQCRRGQANYNPNADFNMDGIVNIKDATIIGVNWQKHI